MNLAQSTTVERVCDFSLPTVLVIAFALGVVILLSSLPWIIGAVMDRRKRTRNEPKTAVIRRDEFESRS